MRFLLLENAAFNSWSHESPPLTPSPSLLSTQFFSVIIIINIIVIKKRSWKQNYWLLLETLTFSFFSIKRESENFLWDRRQIGWMKAEQIIFFMGRRCDQSQNLGWRIIHNKWKFAHFEVIVLIAFLAAARGSSRKVYKNCKGTRLSALFTN